MHLKLFNPLTCKQFKKTTSDSICERARKNWNKVHCSRPGDRKGLETSPCLDHGQVLLSPARKPKSSRLQALTALSKQLQEPTLTAFGRRGAGKKEEVQQKRDAPAASGASQTKMRNQNGMLSEVCLPKFEFACRFLIVLSRFLMLLCLKAKKEFAETLSAILQLLLPPSWLFCCGRQ